MDWASVDRDAFDRCVETLISRRHPHDTVRVINGRGGDGGKDVEVTTLDETRIVYQLKYFPEGFSGPFKNRRGQIKRSFDSMITDPPNRWVLVSPHKFTPSEWAYLGTLRRDHEPLVVDAWDQARLDDYLASNQDLVDYMQRDDELLRQATVLGQERAVLARPLPDLIARVAGLGRVADGVNPNYGFDFARHGSLVSISVRANHEKSDQLPDIVTDIRDAFSVDDPARVDLDRAVKFGSRERITFTADQLRQLSGPETSLDDHLTDVDSEINWALGPPTDPVSCTLEAKDAAGRRLRRAKGTITHWGQGQEGDSLDLDFYGLLTLKLLIPRGQELAKITTNYSITLEHASPRDAEAAVTLSQHLVAAASLELRGPDNTPILTSGPFQLGRSAQWHEEMTVALEIASDLRHLEDYTATDLTMPVSTTPVDRVLLRILRRAYEGKLSLHPTNNTVTFTLATYAPDDRVETLLSGQAGSIFFERPIETVTISDLSFDVEGLSFFHPNMALVASPEEITELRRRRARGEEVTLQLKSQDGTNLRVYMIRKVDNAAPTEITPWCLRSIQEPAGLASTSR
jgi:hypothetical protein